MKTSDYAINQVYSILTGPLGINIPVYKLKKRSKDDPTQYIVLNSLKIGKGILQKVIVNVNYHVKDREPGVPDMALLETGTGTLMSLLETVYAPGIMIDFEDQEYHPEPEIDETYSNIRLKIKIVNT